MNKAQLEAIREALELGDTSWDPEAYKKAFDALKSLEAEQERYDGSARMVTLYREDILHLFDEELANDLQDHDIEYIAGKLHDSIMYDFDLGEALAERISFSYPEFYKSYLTRKDGDDEVD